MPWVNTEFVLHFNRPLHRHRPSEVYRAVTFSEHGGRCYCTVLEFPNPHCEHCINWTSRSRGPFHRMPSVIGFAISCLHYSCLLRSTTGSPRVHMLPRSRGYQAPLDKLQAFLRSTS
ncbi:hypothetical protein CRM22_006679 [Opisthorchis felineus]|uniref:Uncharacterized protein n=1 Tax=Opisthorchis felineus TaxID=147828 RepID=A0A4S2LK04_OPIFE|nr:hypothetical protein CRM22_006679 [Opisthorchis felineus]